ncbi:sensor histidine kinase [Halobacteriovorax sp. HLS]|uniref:sensor histidine kinase n=1 Tax=Halobacteriovorax sp. HLS TaxID=2234000 RepID=UPI000FDAA47C|nr:HAMP domain-containing sensor histidine kinase [Halobacteriovorax sp. HLS]
MNLILYQSFERFFGTIVFSFFAYHALAGISNFKTHKIKSSVWHISMCIMTALYALCLVVGTFDVAQDFGNTILLLLWLLGYGSYLMYMLAIKSFLMIEKNKLNYTKTTLLILLAHHIVFFFTYLLFGYTPLFQTTPPLKRTLFQQAYYITISPTIYGYILGTIAVSGIIYASILILKELSKRKNKESFLKIGVVVTLLATANDISLSMGLTHSLVPLYFLGNVFEAIRLMIHFQKKSFEKIMELEKNVDKLAKVAQFGFAAASIAHDIRNHITIIITAIENLKRVETNPKAKSKEYYYSVIEKHSYKSNDVAELYMNLFKENSSSTKEPIKFSTLIEDVKELVVPLIDFHKIKFELNIEKDFTYQCNTTEVVLCLVNLIKNSTDAIKLMKEPWIKLQSRKQNENIIIEVIDSGLGIEDKIAQNIFELEFTTKDKDSGSGMGLAITKQLLEKNHCSIHYTKMKNTCFSIVFDSESILDNH